MNVIDADNLKDGSHLVNYQRWRIHWGSPAIGFNVNDDTDTPYERAFTLATFLFTVAPGSEWFVGVGSETGYDTTALPGSPDLAANTLIDQFDAHRDRGIVHLECHGDYQCGLVYRDGRATVSDLSSVVAPNAITAAVVDWYSTGRATWPVTEATAVSFKQREIQRTRERAQIFTDIEVESLLRGEMPPPRPQPNTLSSVSDIGWMNTLQTTTLKFPELLTDGVDWTPSDEFGYSFLQLGKNPEDFTFEMAESVHRACGNPTLEEMRNTLAALQS
ncbi:hypothetical protein TSST111916_13775 [Tsukamurella strandjordii]|uniref:hypothetical protein n=1 Tax=Tsukamurella TaxID=2060 RepID=UPI001C7D78D8|nr:hypothetical protein [Tsukamurella sp. TY48]GIZ97628.1 hypothetical protein TTY48_22400 [Tsukamurella sp. TY48]